MTLPFFDIREDWDNSGDVDIWFARDVSENIRVRLAEKLSKTVPYMKDDERNMYHLSNLINNIFTDMVNGQEMRFSPVTNRWEIT